MGTNGTGTITGFTATNVATNQVATITVTPTLNGCTGTPQTFTITVNAKPSVNVVFPLTYCATDGTSAIPFTGTLAGTTFNWSNNNTNTGLITTGTGTIPAFTTLNVTRQEVSTVTVTPTLKGCTGSLLTFALTVNPQVTADTAASLPSICQEGSGLSTIDLASQLIGAQTGGIWADESLMTAGSNFYAGAATLNPNGLPMGTYLFRYTLTALAPCPDAEVDVMIIIDACCKATICLPVTVVRN